MSSQPSLPKQLITAGTAGCIADLVTFPLDTAKVRLQIQGEQEKAVRRYRGLAGTIATITRQEGFRALYGGLSAGLQRQMCFSAIRLGLYESVKTFYTSLLEENVGSLQIGTRVCAGMTTGALAVLVAHPTDLVKIRGQADSSRSSTSTLNAYRAIYREEGVPGLWKGTVPNMGRNSIVNVAEVVVYDVAKDTLLRYVTVPREDVRLHFGSAVIAGFAATLVASPVDVIKTRYMNAPKDQYRGVFDCALRMGQQEGFLAFYKGFVPSFVRLVSWNVVMWISYEQIKMIVF
uniref:Putative mitochondrial uncoupling protein 2 n=1 Tax=Culex tarsalis TaxID=7177 RepID=A0A1Q3FT35_CULTA